MHTARHAFIHFVCADPRTDGWWTVATPIPLILVTVLYVYGSLKLGPRLMAKRKPFDLRLVIVVYNILQVVCNGLLFVHVSSKTGESEIFPSP